MTAAGPGSVSFAAAAQPTLPREVYVLRIVGGCVMLGLGLALPVLPVYAATFGAGPTQIGALVAGLLLCAVSSALTANASSYGRLLVFRSLGGAGSTLFSVSALATLLAFALTDQRGWASAVFEAGFLLGGSCGPALGGLLALVALSAPFVAHAVLLLAAAAAITALVFVGRYAWLVVLLSVYAAGSALLNAAPAALIGDVVTGRAGSGVAVSSMCADVGAGVGPVVVGLIAERVSVPAALVSGATLLVVAFVASWTLTTVRPTRRS